MKTLTLMLTLSVLPFISMSTMAQTASTDQTAPDINTTVTVSGIGVPRHPYPMGQNEFYKFKGSYDLANGNTLSLFNRGNLMFAKISGQQWHCIVASAPNTFVSRDHMMKVRFEPRENGDMGGELLLAAQ